MSCIFESISRILLPSGNKVRSPTTKLDIIRKALNVVNIALQRRADLVVANLPALVGVMTAAIPLLQRSRAIDGPKKASTARVLDRFPPWIGEAEEGLGEEEARLIARLLISLSNARISTVVNADTYDKQQKMSRPLAKHAPAILVSYVRAACDPFAGLSSEVRRQLEPGLFALGDVMTSGGRIDGRGREGEGIGLPFGLGEGPGGEAEKEMWAIMWRNWGRKRYTGQG